MEQLPSTMNWSTQLEPDEIDVKALQRHLSNYNIATAHVEEGLSLAILVRDEKQRLLAGVSGWLWGECLEVEYLWVDEQLRGQGVGQKLMIELEETARSRGCLTVVLDTYSFQAPEFYEKLGYQAFGVIEGYGPGHQKYFFLKKLR